ncbi:hypothetical protein [Nostoc sp.]|uniref:hypothetical protein n=1 Tax=Nostoc sp. TaxID=1180 RepID=UPI002FF7E54F
MHPVRISNRIALSSFTNTNLTYQLHQEPVQSSETLPNKKKKSFLIATTSKIAQSKNKWFIGIAGMVVFGLLGFSIYENFIKNPQPNQAKPSEKTIAEVLNFQTDKPLYEKGQNILLSWTIARPLLLA